MTLYDVQQYQGRDPDLRPSAVNIVIDVLRAFTTTHVAFERGADEILLAETVEEAFALSETHPDYLLAGERNARMVDGFDMGNSPAAAREVDFAGRRLILTTTNGVRATMSALDAEATFVTGWSNAPATLRATRQVAPKDARVNLVASHPVSDEDPACADYLAAELRGETPPSATEVTDRIRTARSAMKFYSTEFALRDLDVACRQFDSGYAMRVETGNAVPRLLKQPSN